MVLELLLQTSTMEPSLSPPTTTTTAEETTLTPSDLRLARSNLANILHASSDMETNLAKMDTHFGLLSETLATTSKTIVPLQSLSMSTKALNTRINRAVSPALKLLEGFSLVESLQDKLLVLSSRLQHSYKDERKRFKHLMKYVACVDRLNAAIELLTRECETVLQKLQEVVEFLSRTKATDRFQIGRLRETVVTLSTLYETEVDSMRYEGLLDEALMGLQDEYEGMLMRLRHRGIGGEEEETVEGMGGCDLGSVEEVEVLRRISDTLATSNCLDICIDIFVKVRYRRAAKALMRLSPEYLKTYAPEEIDDMEWESLETAITFWIQHFDLAVTTIFVSEKKLCNQVLSGLMDGSIWSECFVKVADKIMAVFFRFGEGVARSSREPQKLFKLLDMFASMEKLSDHVTETFEGEAGEGICERFRELQKLLVHASSKVFWEFGFRIEGNQDAAPPPPDGSVPKITRYAVNYLKYLATEGHSAAMAKVFRTEQVWKAGFLSKPGPDEDLLRDAVANVMDALERNVEATKAWYADMVLPHLFKMNAYWYVYMRTRGSELGRLLGEEWLKRKYKKVAEEAAYSYQAQAWGPLVRLLEREEGEAKDNKDAVGAVARGKLDAFMKGFDERLRRHREGYCVPDLDLRKQITEAVVKVVVPAYAGFLRDYSLVLQVKSCVSPESIEELLGQLFDGGAAVGVVVDGRRLGSGGKRLSGGRERDWRNRVERGGSGGSPEFRRSGRGNVGNV